MPITEMLQDLTPEIAPNLSKTPRLLTRVGEDKCFQRALQNPCLL